MPCSANIDGDSAIDAAGSSCRKDALVNVLDHRLRKRLSSPNTILHELPRIRMPAYLVQLPQRGLRRDDRIGQDHFRLNQCQRISLDGGRIMRKLHEKILFPIICFKTAQTWKKSTKEFNFTIQITHSASPPRSPICAVEEPSVMFDTVSWSSLHHSIAAKPCNHLKNSDTARPRRRDGSSCGRCRPRWRCRGCGSPS